MSMVPMLFRDWWDDYEFSRPSRLFDQRFGTGLKMDDLMSSMSMRPTTSRYYRPWRNTELARQDSGSTLTSDKDNFRVILDVQQFTPEEVTVKITNNCIVVEGKHEEKQDEHGFISRHFIRRYMLPVDHEAKDVCSTLSSDGILTITAPKKAPQKEQGERIVPIKPTGPQKSTVTPMDNPSPHASTPQPTVEQPN
ncbi:protein lethal(2)essential for life-like [Atheta coriaria]|uniref:protein lethal(2)essential for life-like n=1 Tax=Dalotia coriaria TaxID=877792 RepID=UPI0031F40C1A